MKYLFISILIWISFFKVTYSQTEKEPRVGIQQDVIQESDLIRSWKLESECTCARCHSFIPTETILLNFYNNHTCSGAILTGKDTTLKGSWSLVDHKLTITYKDKSGENNIVEYRVFHLTQSELKISRRIIDGSAERKFAAL